MFDPNKVSKLNIPGWKMVFRAELQEEVVAIIAVHDTTRGPGLGGCRMVQYDNESDALTDVLRLSKGMTFKNAIADLPLGGGKSVIICDPKIAGTERERILEEFGKFLSWVNRDHEIYITAEDMNTTVPDMHVVARHTRHTSGMDIDPSPYTAVGVLAAVEFTVDYFAMDLFEGKRSLEGKKILIQGLGKVGKYLVEPLQQAGAVLFVSDIRQEAVDQVVQQFPKITPVSPDRLLDAEVDIFVPCARGEVVNQNDLDRITFKIVCGSANNQLPNMETGLALQKRGIVYCPDYVASMGGVCSIQFIERDRLSEKEALEGIQRTVRKMLGLTFRTGFKNNLAFSEAVDHAVKKIVWGDRAQNLDFSNAELFPLTYTSEPVD